MRRIAALIAVAALSLTLCRTARAELEAENLKCEYVRTPLGLETKHPRLSWTLSADERAQKQTAYRLIVASSKDKLAENNGDLWDTGKVKSDDTINIKYRGKSLKKGMRCWWKVRAWDRNGDPGPWSEPSWWEMGLRGKGAWEAEWIRPPTSQDPDVEPDPAPLFRRAFETDRTVEKARVYISGVGYYELYLNGDKVGNHVLDPAFTRYDERVLYESYDVTDHLKQGKNAAGVVVGNGWYNMHTRAVWNFDKAPWRDRPTMICQLRLTYADGSTRTIVSDGNWKVSTGPIRFDSIRNGETYDLNEVLEPDDEVSEEYEATDYIKEKRKEAVNEENVFSPSVWHENRAGNISILPYSCALRANASHNYLLVNGERHLTPREMLRLQGFPEDFEVKGAYTRVKEQVGNSVPVPMIEAVAEEMIDAVRRNDVQPVYEQTELTLS